MKQKNIGYSPLLDCFVSTVHYDFRQRKGRLHLPKGESPTLAAVLTLFMTVDPAVQQIFIFDAGAVKTAMRRSKDGRWETRTTDHTLFPHERTQLLQWMAAPA